MADDDKKSLSSNDADREDDVGYRKPPKANQFKPGQSGNTAGRPKRHKSLNTIIKNVAQKKVTVRSAKGSKKMPAMEALVEKTMNSALSGDHKSAQTVFTMMQTAGLGADVADNIDAANAKRLSDEDEAILNRYLKPKQSAID